MRNSTTYEWCYELLDENGDILDCDHEEKLADFTPNRRTDTLVLIKNVGNEDEGLIERCWAYVQDGRLPECFSGDNGEYPNQLVPKRFKIELDRVTHVKN